MDDIPTLKESDYKNLFITCTHININKEKRDLSKPSVHDITTVITDGFDWEDNFNKAYDND